jgi:hypothetical protein
VGEYDEQGVLPRLFKYNTLPHFALLLCMIVYKILTVIGLDLIGSTALLLFRKVRVTRSTTVTKAFYNRYMTVIPTILTVIGLDLTGSTALLLFRKVRPLPTVAGLNRPLHSLSGYRPIHVIWGRARQRLASHGE